MQFVLKPVLVSVFVLLLSLSIAEAKHKKSSDSDAHSSCVYNYMACRDNCDYYQDRAQINPCKSKCDRTYGCRAKAVKPSADHSNDPA